MKFSGAVGCIPQEEVIRFWDQLPNYLQESQQCKNGGLEEVCALSVSASNVLPLAALFHSENLVEMEQVIRWRATCHRQRRCKGKVRGGDYTCIEVIDVNVVNYYGFGS